MANQNKQTNTPAAKTAATTPKTPAAAKTVVKTPSRHEYFAFEKENYILMIVGILVIVLGFALMSGGGTSDPNVYNPELFATRRIVIAPMVVVAGYIIEIIAILKRGKNVNN